MTWSAADRGSNHKFDCWVAAWEGQRLQWSDAIGQDLFKCSVLFWLEIVRKSDMQLNKDHLTYPEDVTSGHLDVKQKSGSRSW